MDELLLCQNRDEPLSLQVLEESLQKAKQKLNSRQAELNSLVEDNKENFTEYLEKVQELLEQWAPLERELANKTLYGDPAATNLRKLVKEYEEVAKTFAMTQGDDEECYFNYLESSMMELVQSSAKRPDYEKTIKGNVTISRKTEELLNNIEKILSLCPTSLVIRFNGSALSSIEVYVSIFQDEFDTQLQQLPHLAALFHNDCFTLAEFACDKLECSVEGVKELQMRGTMVLEGILHKHHEELTEICSPKLWLSTDSQLQEVQRSLAQGILRVNQICKIYKGILEATIYNGVATELIFQIINWMWKGLLSLQSIEKENIYKLISPVMELVEASQSNKEINSYMSKLNLLQRISQLNLLQVSIAVQREEYKEVLEMPELRSVVMLLFPNTTMKSALLAEIDAEIN